VSPELEEIRRRLEEAAAAARTAIADAGALDALDALARTLTGRRSAAGEATEAIKDLTPEDRPVAGKAVGEFRDAVAELVEARRLELATDGVAASAGLVDLTLGGHARARGHLHLVTQVQRELEDIFVGLGYRVAEGPEVEDDWHNFEALNIPPAHPARSMQDTLYVALGDDGGDEQAMLRTHTSPVQIRTMETTEPPIYVVAPGRTYRNETLDARHSPVFHQMECLAVDRGLTMADLFGTIEAFAKRLFDDESVRTRFRSDFFPYTEPSAELAVSCVFCRGEGCRVCSHTGWIELGGCGMVDPAVFTAVGYDPEEWQGFAFGFGLERIAMIRYGIGEIRTFFDNDLRFLAQY
jgi:phenylalanyl-tRNA synthetase alpha chain